MGMLEYIVTTFVERVPWERWIFKEPDPTEHLQRLLERQAATQVANPGPRLLSQITATTAQELIEESTIVGVTDQQTLEYQLSRLRTELRQLEIHLSEGCRIGL